MQGIQVLRNIARQKSMCLHIHLLRLSRLHEEEHEGSLVLQPTAPWTTSLFNCNNRSLCLKNRFEEIKGFRDRESR